MAKSEVSLYTLLQYRKRKKIDFKTTDFKTKRENYKSNSITVIVLEKKSYPYTSIIEPTHPQLRPNPLRIIAYNKFQLNSILCSVL